MRNILLALLLITGCTSKAPIIAPTPTPIVEPIPSSTPSPKGLGFIQNLGVGVNKAFAEKAVSLLNSAEDCVKKKALTHAFTSLHNIDGKQVQTRAEAIERYFAGAPYALDLRSYTSSWLSRTVVGYTFNYKDDAEKESETRLYTNTYAFAWLTVKEYAAHIAHELSHQARAGAYVHWTVHQGSFPYEIGDIVEECLE